MMVLDIMKNEWCTSTSTSINTTMADLANTRRVHDHLPETATASSQSSSMRFVGSARSMLLIATVIIAAATTRVDGFAPLVGRQLPHHQQKQQQQQQHRYRRNLVAVAASKHKYGKSKDYENNYDDDDDDDDDPPEVNVKDFYPPNSSPHYGLNRGKSAPSQRKAMGTSSGASTTVHVCTNCGSEFVKWMGRCPTCKEWNTLQEFAVARGPTDAGRPSFASQGRSSAASSSSWLDGILADSTGKQSAAAGYMVPPVRMTDIIAEYGTDGDSEDATGIVGQRKKRNRIKIPGDDELNTVLGGGLMKGSLVLLGGDPGVGKSTLLLQTAASVATLATPTVGIGMGGSESGNVNPSGETTGPVWYVSGEETPEQIASRASRLGIASSELFLLSETQVNILCEQVVDLLQPRHAFQEQDSERLDAEATDAATRELLRPKAPSLLIVDSIQTMVCDAGGSSAAGGVTQVRECVALLLRLAKSVGIPIILVGHVTKSGDVAGPRTVEHMVDAVLYLEGTSSGGADNSNLRMLRAAKNRFGSSTEVGVYEMTTGRLLPISDPSSFLLANRIETKDLEGCAVALVVEGTLRVLTVEIQALVTSFSASEQRPRRNANGISYSRIQLLLGVLQKHLRLFFGRHDVYVNVAGALELSRGESGAHASDLAIAVALASSLKSIPIRGDTAFCGEIGLLGELRRIPNLERRVEEARRMGFSRVITPPHPNNKFKRRNYSKGKRGGGSSYTTASTRTMDGIEWVACENLRDAVNAGLVHPIPMYQGKRKKNGDGGHSGADDSSEYGSSGAAASADFRGSLENQLNLDMEPILDDDEDEDEDDDDDDDLMEGLGFDNNSFE